jgi:hypothetical protein
MTVPTITLTGPALAGVAPHLMARGLADMPATVRLGRIRSDVPSTAPRLSRFFDLRAMRNPPPASTNRRDKAAASLSRMYLNDQLGCCVISGKAHALGLWSTDSDSPGIVTATDAEIAQQYRSVCGPADRGCMITDVLDYCVRSGFQANGTRYKIDGYAQVNWTDKLLVQTAIHLFGACTIGINLPDEWTTAAVWDATNSPLVGGHDVTPVDYDERGVYVSSWGRVYLMTWRAFLSTNWVEEMYVMLSRLWTGADKMSPAGVDYDGLLAAVKTIQGGGTPDVGPAPVVPPTPDPVPPAPTPAYPNYAVTLTGSVPGLFGSKPVTLSGVAVPRPPAWVSGAWGIDPTRAAAPAASVNWFGLLMDLRTLYADLTAVVGPARPLAEKVWADVVARDWSSLFPDLSALFAALPPDAGRKLWADARTVLADFGISV